MISAKILGQDGKMGKHALGKTHIAKHLAQLAEDKCGCNKKSRNETPGSGKRTPCCAAGSASGGRNFLIRDAMRHSHMLSTCFGGNSRATGQESTSCPAWEKPTSHPRPLGYLNSSSSVLGGWDCFGTVADLASASGSMSVECWQCVSGTMKTQQWRMEELDLRERGKKGFTMKMS